MSQPRVYGYDGPAGAINPAMHGLTGLPVGAMARGSSALEDPPLAGLRGLAPARALGPSPVKEELDVVGRSSLGIGASIPDVERHSSLANFDEPSEDESNILFVDCLPTDCTRREVARILPALVLFCIIFPHLCKFHFASLDFCWKICSVVFLVSRTSE